MTLEEYNSFLNFLHTNSSNKFATRVRVRAMVCKATFNNISVLLVEIFFYLKRVFSLNVCLLLCLVPSVPISGMSFLDCPFTFILTLVSLD